MAFDHPTAVDGFPLPSLAWRRSQAGLLVHADDPQSAMPGVLAGLACTVTGLTLTYGVGSAVVTPASGANGSYLAVAGTSGTVDFVTNDPTYARIDRVVLRLYDTGVDGSGETKAAIEIIQGTASASPVAPTLPAGRLELYQAQVPKLGTGSITLVDKRVYTAASGGTIVVGSVAQLPTGSWLRPSQHAAVVGTSYSEYLWNGTEWRVWHGYCRLVRAASAQACTNTADTIIQWDTVGAESTADWRDGNDLVIPTSGVWNVAANVSLAANATGIRACYVKCTAPGGGITYLGKVQMNAPTTGTWNAQVVGGPVYLVAGSKLQLVVWQNSGGALNTDNVTHQTWLAVSK